MWNKFFILAASIILLTACGSDAGSGTTTIDSFTVTGSTDPVNGVVPLNSGYNDGQFNISWKVSSSDPYHVEMYMSEDAALSKTDDINFFGKNCGKMSSLYNCSSSGSFSCNFTSTYQIFCDSTKKGTLNTFIDQMPKKGYIILEACNGLGDSCKTSSIAIELQ